MDFHRLLRRDLQFLCKRNKIPANITNVAMADALTALEIVEGLDEYMHQLDSNALQSPITVAKQPPNTATGATRRKTAVKAEPQSSSMLVTSSSHSASESLAGEMDQEPKIKNVKFEANVAKTPAARSTRKASAAATSCNSKVHESIKDVSVQSVYSTRRSTRLLEKCMADLSLKTEEILDKPAKDGDTEQKVSVQEKNQAVSEEAEVTTGRNLSASMEKEWEILKKDSDQVVVDVEINVDHGEIAVFDANTDNNLETTNEVMGYEKESKNSLVQEETLQANKAMCEEGEKQNDNDQEIGGLEIYVGLGDITPFLEDANSDNKVSKKDFEQVDPQETEDAIQENDCEPEKIKNSYNEDTTNNDGGDSEIEPEEDNSGVDSGDTVSEADSNKAVMGSDVAEEEMILYESEVSASPTLQEDGRFITTPFAEEPISVQYPRPNKSISPSKKSAMKLINVDNENKENMETMMIFNNNDCKGEETKKKKKKVKTDEENLKDVSMRQLVKLVKELSIKSHNRTALQILPGNNQIAE